MTFYEHVFLARQDITSQQMEALMAQYKTLIEENGGKVGKTEYWGVKNIAFRIKKNKKAHYALMNIDGPASAVNEMERQMRINEDVIRFQTVRVEALEEEPSAQMARKDRDDKRRRDDEGFGFEDR
jgi:small subunit ribosomal protein S6